MPASQSAAGGVTMSLSSEKVDIAEVIPMATSLQGSGNTAIKR